MMFKKRLGMLVRLVIIAIICLAFLMPLVIMISTSFMSRGEAVSMEGWHLIPRVFFPQNYSDALDRIPFVQYMLNTMLITACCLIGQIITVPMVAYSISKIKWPGSRVLFNLIISSMMIPYVVTMIPLYRVWATLGLTGTYAPLIIPSLFGTPFNIIIIRQFFMNIPDSLIEAAHIDGASEFHIYSRIMVPLAKPAITVVGIYVMITSWSDYLGPLLYINDPDNYTLSIGLQSFINTNNVDWTMLMAAATLFVLPVMVAFIAFQRNLIQGISTTGLKS